MRRTFFHHIPKTGGTSFMLQATRAVGDDNWYTYDQYGTIPDGYEDRVLLASHAAAVQVGMYVGDRFEFTILRDPVERVISWVNFEQDRGRVLPLLRDAESYAEDRQVKQLGGRLNGSANSGVLEEAKARLEGMDFVGFTDTWTQDQATLYEQLQLDLKPMRLNTSSGSCDFNEEAIEYVRKITVYDQMLYDWAKEKWWG